MWPTPVELYKFGDCKGRGKKVSSNPKISTLSMMEESRRSDSMYFDFEISYGTIFLMEVRRRIMGI